MPHLVQENVLPQIAMETEVFFIYLLTSLSKLLIVLYNYLGDLCDSTLSGLNTNHPASSKLPYVYKLLIYYPCMMIQKITSGIYVISHRHMHRLEMVQRSAARIVRQIRRGDRQSMTTILRQLHWLPVRKRIDFKLLVLVHRAIYNGTPEYLAALLRRHTPPRSLRSASGLLLEVPRVNLERFGCRAFACAGPTLWNKLPRNIRDNSNITQFKKQLKTLLFST